MPPTPPPSDRPVAPAWHELTPGVWTATTEPAHCNLGLVVGETGCLLVESGASPDHGAAILASVATVTDRPLVAVVVTHWHWDHAFGLAAFGGIETVGHENLWPRIAAEPPQEVAAELGFDRAELVPPTRELALATAYDLGGRRVEVAHLGHGHTDGDLVVVVPESDVVFAGDLVESAGPPWFGPDSSAAEWPATLDGLIGLLGDKSAVVPGHGPVMSRMDVFQQRSELAAVAGELRQLAESGVAQSDVLARGRWPYPVEHLALGLDAAWAELGLRRHLPMA